MKKFGWFLFIIFIGLIPFIMRLLVFFFIPGTEKSLFFLFNETDFIILGFIVTINSLKELKNVSLSSKNLGDTIVKENIWINISVIISLFSIIIYSGIIFLSYLNNSGFNIDLFLLKIISIILCIISVIFGFTVIDRINNIESQILIANREVIK